MTCRPGLLLPASRYTDNLTMATSMLNAIRIESSVQVRLSTLRRRTQGDSEDFKLKLIREKSFQLPVSPARAPPFHKKITRNHLKREEGEGGGGFVPALFKPELLREQHPSPRTQRFVASLQVVGFALPVATNGDNIYTWWVHANATTHSDRDPSHRPGPGPPAASESDR